MIRRAIAILISCLAASLSSGAADLHSTAYRAQEYRAIRQRLLHGWGTWNSSNILEQVHLPDGAAVAMSFKETNWISADYLRSALIGVQDSEAPSVRPGLHALDGSFSEYELKWKELEVKITSAAVGDGTDDLVTLIEPVHSSALPHEVFVAAKMLWNQPGAVSRVGDELEVQTGARHLRVHVTASPVPELYAGQDTPYLALLLDSPVGISVGHRRSLDEIRSILTRQRAALLARAAQYGDNAATYAGIEAVLGWNTIYEPKYDRMITTVGRIWNEEYGGYCLYGWDNFFLPYACSLFSRDLAYANFAEHLRSLTPDGFIPNVDEAEGRTSWDRSDPPVGSLMLREIYKRYGDRWILEASFDDLLSWNRWWPRARMNGKLLEWGSSVAGNPLHEKEAHTRVAAAWESGMDDSPMFEDVPFNPRTSMFDMQDVGLNGLYIADCQALAEIADVLGRKVEAAELRLRAEKFTREIEALWNPGAGLYLNRRTDTGEWSKRISPTMFYPLIGRVPTTDRAAVGEMLSARANCFISSMIFSSCVASP